MLVALVLAGSLLLADAAGGLTLMDGAVPCDRVSAMEAVMMGSDKLEALSCKQWTGGVPIEAADIPAGMTRGIVQIRVHDKLQWTSLRMIKKAGQ